MKLPEKNSPVSIESLIELAKEHGKNDIVEILTVNPPDDIFVSDGCSMWPDSWKKKSIYVPCFWHDIRYWCGMPGDDKARLFADTELAKDVADATDDTELARTMFLGVSAGGTELLPFKWRWAYGRN